ncbi:MAG TPA: hypothetical protein PLY93_00290 [Turneriella sp.]|nr:hypothetical protein [Turneriella sp.]
MKKNKKDIFRKAIADDLGENREDASALGDFVSDMQRKRGDTGDNYASESKNGASAENQKSKNDLPEQKEEKRTGSVMESRLKRLTSGEQSPVQPAAFADDDEPPRWRRYALFAVVGLLALTILYWVIFSTAQKPTIYLANTAIEEANTRHLGTTNLVFARGKTLYLLFSSGGRLGQDKIIAKLTEVYADASNMIKEESVAQVEGSVKPTWRYFTTQFQKDNFTHAGRYRVHVLGANGEVIASQEFRVQ